MKHKKKPVIIVSICLAVAIAAFCLWFFWLKDLVTLSGATPVYVNSVSTIVGLDTGTNPRYSGIVEPQKTYKINKDESKTVAEILIAEGDEVEEKQPIAVIEAMKMETNILAPAKGVVDKIYIKEGQQVKAGELIAKLK